MTDYTKAAAIAAGELSQLVFWSGDIAGDTVTEAQTISNSQGRRNASR